MSTKSLMSASPAVEQQVSSSSLQSGVDVMEQELAAYFRELPRLLAEGNAGRFALIKDDEVLSVWDTQHDVLQAGYERFGLAPFSVKKIDATDPERMAALRAKEGAVCPS